MIKQPHNTFGGGSPLPAGYIPLQYIQSTGKAYIDTNYFPTGNTNIFVDTKFNTTAGGLCAIVCRWSEAPNYGTLGIYRGSARDLVYYLGDFNRGYYYQYSPFNYSTNRFTAEINDGKCYYNGNLIYTYNKQQFQSPYSLYICAFNNLGSLSEGKPINIYEVKIGEGDYQHDFIPALRTSDNKPGLYDLCSSICPLTGTPFYINAGTGEFLYN